MEQMSEMTLITVETTIYEKQKLNAYKSVPTNETSETNSTGVPWHDLKGKSFVVDTKY